MVTNPFSVDVTSIKFVNGGAEDATVAGSFLLNA